MPPETQTETGFDLPRYLAGHRKRVEADLTEWLNRTDDGRLVDAMKYSLLAGGKRLRPILTIAAAETVGGDPQKVLPAACAVEMIHTYSLIHDDLPAMDNDRLRRGLPTNHIAFDEATAILAGDALLTAAFDVMSQAAQAASDAGLRPWMRAIQKLAEAAGAMGMVGGQMRDMLASGRALQLPQLARMHQMKTGALICASVQMGAILCNASAPNVQRLDAYARAIGLAFQVTDDILNVEGDASRMGKATGTDQALGKNTYPALMGLKAAKAYADDLVNDALQQLTDFDNKANPLQAIARYIVQRRR